MKCICGAKLKFIFYATITINIHTIKISCFYRIAVERSRIKYPPCQILERHRLLFLLIYFLTLKTCRYIAVDIVLRKAPFVLEIHLILPFLRKKYIKGFKGLNLKYTSSSPKS